MKRNTITVFIGTLIFALLCIKLVDFTAILDPEDETAVEIKHHEHMKRVVEGAFLDANGEVIFMPEKPYTEDTAYLPVEYSYIIGYNHPQYLRSGLRKKYNEHLYNDNGTGKGGSIQLTIDNVLQTKAYTVLRERDMSGSVIVMNAKNGEILAMAGRRGADFDINKLTEKMDEYKKIDGMLLSPATGDYKAPGSVFKILTSAAAIIGGLEGYTYEDTGVFMVDENEINNAFDKVYGHQDLQMALANSTNTYFASLSLELGERAMGSIFNDFLVGETIDLDFAMLKSAATFDGSDYNLAQMGFGQGSIAISPLHIAMIAQSIVNEGTMIKPTLVKAMYDAEGTAIFRNNEYNVLAETVKPEVAEAVKELMLGVTEKKNPGWLNYTQKVYSKTGTAQMDGTKLYNSYHLGMTEDYVILVSVNNTHKYGADLGYVIDRFLKELY